ncbi:Ig-like domain-containing protein [bacterium]|nr:Ig-like domain-containing protein [bacterium]
MLSSRQLNRLLIASGMIILIGLSCTQKNPLDSTSSILGNQPNLVNMKAEPHEVAAGGGISVIQVTLLDKNDKPMEGGIIYFSLEGEGTLDTTAATTNSQGVASVSFYSGTKAAQPVIKATYKKSTKQVALSVLSASSGKAMLLVSSSKSSLYANGVDSTKINIHMIPGEDTDVSYVLVDLSTSFGTMPLNVLLNNDGKGSVTLTSDTSYVDTQALVTATYESMIGNSAVPIKAVSFDVTTDQARLPADGKSTCKITATTKQKSSGKPIANAAIIFDSDVGDIQSQSNTEVNGKATVTLTSTSMPDTTMVTAWYGSLSDSVRVIFYSSNVSDERSYIRSMTAEKAEIWSDPQYEDRITVQVDSADGSPKRGATVYFTTSAGMLSHEQVVTDANGQAEVYLSGYPSDFDSTATITADLYNGTSSAGVSVLLKSESYKPRYIEIRFDPAAIGVIETGQISTTNVIASVKDVKYRLVGDNIRVFFDIIEEHGGVKVTTVTNQGVPTINGQAKITLTAGTRSGVVRMRARLVDDPLTIDDDESEIEVESTKLLIHAGPPFMADRNDPNTSHLDIVADRLNIWEGQDYAIMSVIVGDKYKNPCDRQTAIYLTATGGVITTQSFTDKNGIAIDTLYAASPSPTVNRYHGFDLNLYDASVSQHNGGVGPAPNFLGTIPPLDYGGDYIWNPNYDPDNNEKFHVIQYIPGDSPDFEGSEVPNTNSIKFSDPETDITGFPTSWDWGENDGIARIRASTIGVDANSDSIYVWNWGAVIFSGHILTGPVRTPAGVWLDGFRDNSEEAMAAREAANRPRIEAIIGALRNGSDVPASVTNSQIYDQFFPTGTGHIVFLGESINLMIRIYDRNGNPIHCGAKITAKLASSAPLGLSWTEYENETGTGTTFYPLTVNNEVNPAKPRTGASPVQIEVNYRGGDVYIQTRSIRAEAMAVEDYIDYMLFLYYETFTF